MALIASCNALYFPREPRDNVLEVRWSAQDAPLEPHTSIIFKAKCTAPQRFHALPRYGALLLADATGAATSSSDQRTTITFGLRESHSGRGDDISPTSVSRQTAPTPSHTSRASSATPGGPAYQERFAIEYVMIKSEPLAFQQILNSRAGASRLTDVVKNVWSLVASGAIPRSHLGVQAAINLKVYMENVVLQQSDPAPNGGDEATKIVVPPQACLVLPMASQRHGRSVTESQYTDGSRHAWSPSPRLSSAGDGADQQGSTSSVSRRKPVGELRALREEIDTMRRESSTPHSTAGGNVRNNSLPCSSTPSNQPSEHKGTAVMEPLSAHRAAGPSSHEDVIMKFDMSGAENRSGAPGKQKKEGLKVYMVLMLMFALYVCLLFMRRGATHTVKVGSGNGTDAADKRYASQLSLKEAPMRK